MELVELIQYGIELIGIVVHQIIPFLCYIRQKKKKSLSDIGNVNVYQKKGIRI